MPSETPSSHDELKEVLFTFGAQAMPDNAGTLNETAEMSVGTGYPLQIGHYRLGRKLGEGGMGVVFLAYDTVRKRDVALKLLNLDRATAEHHVNRFLKEARILAEVRHPHIAQLEEAGCLEGTFYIAMEFVNGTTLDDALDELRIFPEELALSLIYDVALGIAELHRRGIVHRDVKPGNILLAATTEASEFPSQAVHAALAAGIKPLVKLTDFGLARHIDQSDSMQLTKPGTMLGTPLYFAPEQCSGTGAVSPATDVYSLGITLFHLLAGRPPFKAPDFAQVIAAHCFTPAPDLRKLNPSISDPVAELVARALRKRPADRYIDAEQFADEIDQILRGKLPHNVPTHPLVPPASNGVIETSWTWDLTSDPLELWPLVSHTDRVNHAIGLPAVSYTTERTSRGELLNIGSFWLGWAKLVWQEHPFEWIEGQRFGVLREFRTGPFQWFVSMVELKARPEGGTRLIHTVKIAPAGWLGKLLAYLEINVKGSRAIDRVYRRIDEQLQLQQQKTKHEDPYSQPLLPSRRCCQQVEACVQKMQAAGATPEAITPLATFVRDQPAAVLARLRPLVLARQLRVDRHQLLEACLHGTQAGLLTLRWDIICPTCRVSASIADTLKQIGDHARCDACDLDFQVDFGRRVELFFQPNPEIRPVALKTYCLGGPEHAPHVISQLKLEPGEQADVELQLSAGTYLLRGALLPYTLRLNVDPVQGTSSITIPLAEGLRIDRLPLLRTGRQLLRFVNQCHVSQVVRLERTIPQADVVTAVDASRNALFRQFFPQEILSEDQLTEVVTATFLAIVIPAIRERYAELGDVAGRQSIQVQQSRLMTIGSSCGARVLSQTEAELLLVCTSTEEALATISSILDDPIAFDARGLQLALHRGVARVGTNNGHEEYFGEAVETARELKQVATTAGFVISSTLADDDEFQQSLVDFGYEMPTKLRDYACVKAQSPKRTP